MKRMICVLSLFVLGMVCVLSASIAQQPVGNNTRAQITATLSKFMYAVNNGNGPVMALLISNTPDVEVISQGRVIRGPEAVDASINSMFGAPGRYHVSLGAVNIARISKTIVLATGPYKLTHTGTTAETTGQVSFVMKDLGKGKWQIVHMHRSVLPQTTAGTVSLR